MPKQWSTKNLSIIEVPTREKTGIGRFEFTDDYSVFHYSKMPDQLKHKGEALCKMTSYTFELLKEQGIPTHFLGFIEPKSIQLRLVRLLYPQHGEISPGEKNYLIPLQVVCRNMLPKGSSIHRRLASGKITLQEINLMEIPKANQKLQHPIIEFTTKLEEIDRFITHEEARKLACLTPQQFARLKEMTLQVNQVVSKHAAEIGLEHADSKIELAIDDAGEIMVVDTAGTGDENRFLLQGTHVTKQMLRDYYLVTEDLERRVQQWVANNQPRNTWPKPNGLPTSIMNLAALVYQSLCERWTGKPYFNAPKLEELLPLINSAIPKLTPERISVCN